ncbi:alpha/beta hydrolase [Neolewinella litorea]|uniref:Alpha/beta fold hydrolase n=1 Tax=Neolewinella litorea TaxID=2562452 RepID=A0A4S4NM68_9BACT|nr:alpha/beta fold hydrolase [Neolewinella litorea]THH40065.1 alpha/beta fold hydrolase [Neolewinella litorea]
MVWCLLLLTAGFAVFLFQWLPRRIIRPRRRLINLDPGDLGFAFEASTLLTDDGLHLATYYVPATGPARGNLLILHGKDSARELYLEYLPQLVPYGYNVLLIDARAHGRSQGTYTTFGYREWADVVAGVRRLRYLATGLPTGVFGHSMGGAVALQAMARSPEIDFGIVESAFTHLGDITHAYACRQSGLDLPRPVIDCLLDRADHIAGFEHRRVEPLRAASRVRQPVLVIHGAEDRNIDVDQGRQLYAALGSRQKELFIVPGAGHNDITEVGGDFYFRRLRAFLDEVTAVH